MRTSLIPSLTKPFHWACYISEQSVVARIGTKGEKEDEDGNIDRDEEIVRDLEARLREFTVQL